VRSVSIRSTLAVGVGLALGTLAAVLLLFVVPAHAAGTTAGVAPPVAGIFGAIKDVVLGPLEFGAKELAGFLVTLLQTVADLLIPDWLAEPASGFLTWLVATTDWSQTFRNQVGAESVYSGINGLQSNFQYFGFGLLTSGVTWTVMTGYLGQRSGLDAVRLLFGAGVALLFYRWGWAQLSALSNVITSSLLDTPAVTKGFSQMIALGAGGGALASFLLGPIIAIAVGLALLGLIAAKVALLVLSAVVYVTGGFVLGLVTWPFGRQIVAAWTTMLLGVFALPIVWTALFAVSGAMFTDIGTAGGKAVVTQGIIKGTLSQLTLAIAGFISLYLAIKAAGLIFGMVRSVPLFQAAGGGSGGGGGLPSLGSMGGGRGGSPAPNQTSSDASSRLGSFGERMSSLVSSQPIGAAFQAAGARMSSSGAGGSPAAASAADPTGRPATGAATAGASAATGGAASAAAATAPLGADPDTNPVSSQDLDGPRTADHEPSTDEEEARLMAVEGSHDAGVEGVDSDGNPTSPPEGVRMQSAEASGAPVAPDADPASATPGASELDGAVAAAGAQAGDGEPPTSVSSPDVQASSDAAPTASAEAGAADAGTDAQGTDAQGTDAQGTAESSVSSAGDGQAGAADLPDVGADAGAPASAADIETVTNPENRGAGAGAPSIAPEVATGRPDAVPGEDASSPSGIAAPPPGAGPAPSPASPSPSVNASGGDSASTPETPRPKLDPITHRAESDPAEAFGPPAPGSAPAAPGSTHSERPEPRPMPTKDGDA
jgi:hypothetical protein